MNATDKLLELDNTKKVIPVAGSSNLHFSHSDCQDIADPTGIALEEGELLYGLIRTTKPQAVLETGTNIGVSASYIALGLKDNGSGHLTTIEHSTHVANRAKAKFVEMGLSDLITVEITSTQDYFAKLPQDQKFDFLWLDTELKERYQELLTLFPHVTPGGIICIHDLWCLDFDWFGGVPDDMKQLLWNGDLRCLTFNTVHGLTVFQKRRKNDYLADLFRSA